MDKPPVLADVAHTCDSPRSFDTTRNHGVSVHDFLFQPWLATRHSFDERTLVLLFLWACALTEDDVRGYHLVTWRTMNLKQMIQDSTAQASEGSALLGFHESWRA